MSKFCKFIYFVNLRNVSTILMKYAMWEYSRDCGLNCEKMRAVES